MACQMYVGFQREQCCGVKTRQDTQRLDNSGQTYCARGIASKRLALASTRAWSGQLNTLSQ